MSALQSVSETGAPSVRVFHIDIWGRPAGYAVPARGGVRFLAGSPHLAALHGMAFPTLGHARLAAIAEARAAPPFSEGWDD